jgi:hypothetical protein
MTPEEAIGRDGDRNGSEAIAGAQLRPATEPRTDLMAGTLSVEDRELFLRVWGLPESTPDEDILVAIGA